jgi:hypothetical protein
MLSRELETRKGEVSMRIKSNVQAGKITANHNQTLAR